MDIINNIPIYFGESKSSRYINLIQIYEMNEGRSVEKKKEKIEKY